MQGINDVTCLRNFGINGLLDHFIEFPSLAENLKYELYFYTCASAYEKVSCQM